MIQDGIAGSSATLSKMTRKLRMVCRKALRKYKRERGQVVGGRTEFVVIDESNFRHKRKVGYLHLFLMLGYLSVEKIKQSNEQHDWSNMIWHTHLDH